MKTILEKLDLKTLLILGLIIVILFMRMCDGDSTETNNKIINVGGKKYEVIKHTTDTIIVPVKQTVYKEGKTIYVEKPIYVNVPPKVDTSLILKDYFAKYTYKDTLKLKDSLGYITVTDTITKNRILNRTFNANVNKFIVKDSIFIKDLPRNEFFLGGTAGFDRANIVNFFGPNLVFKNKEDKMFSLGIGYGLNKQISVLGGMYWNISKKNKK